MMPLVVVPKSGLQRGQFADLFPYMPGCRHRCYSFRWIWSRYKGYSQLQAGLSFLPFTLLLIGLSRYAGGWADRHGPRALLIAGPVIAGVGMILLSLIGQVHRHSDYWFSFFPGIAGFWVGNVPDGGAVDGHGDGDGGVAFSGVASGVNNALSRVASVFANAVLGALAVVLFTGGVGRKVDGLGLDPRDRQEVMAETAKLGDAKVPEDVSRGSGSSDPNGEGWQQGGTGLGFGGGWRYGGAGIGGVPGWFYRGIPDHSADCCGACVYGGADGGLVCKKSSC